MLRALLDSERRFRAMFESSAVGMALFTLDGQLVESNPAFDVSGLRGVIAVDTERGLLTPWTTFLTPNGSGSPQVQMFDVDGDGTLDIRFKPSINYYGLFDSSYCYNYSTGNTRFEPAGTTDNLGRCTGSAEWSGRWLNYMTTSRIDALRKVLYGGHREVDTTSDTVLTVVAGPLNYTGVNPKVDCSDIDVDTPEPSK